jgi:cyclic beta-1,2-glucan synthetase
VIAYAMLGEGDQAGELLRMLNPIKRTASRTGVYAYKVEPYELAADIYSEAPHARRGGWTWYTGASGWFYRAGLESILGLQVRGDRLLFEPCIPRAWQSYSMVYRHGASVYQISIDNPNGATQGIYSLELDGVAQTLGGGIKLADDGQTHKLKLVLG